MMAAPQSYQIKKDVKIINFPLLHDRVLSHPQLNDGKSVFPHNFTQSVWFDGTDPVAYIRVSMVYQLKIACV